MNSRIPAAGDRVVYTMLDDDESLHELKVPAIIASAPVADGSCDLYVQMPNGVGNAYLVPMATRIDPPPGSDGGNIWQPNSWEWPTPELILKWSLEW